jgi:hypothetical protein
MDKKEIIKMLMKKYNCNYIKVLPDLDILKAGSVSNLEAKIIFDIKNDKDGRHLLIKDTITKDNIYLYCEFLEKEDLRQMIIKFENEYSNKIDNEIMDIIDILENRLQVL